MHYRIIPWLLAQEPESDFQTVAQRWRPKNLLQIRQAQLLLKDIRSRRQKLEMARDEFATLRYADRYIKYLRRMRLWARDASFSWKADQLKFLISVVGFYSDYGSVLRLLRLEQLRGSFVEHDEQEIAL